MLEIVKKVEQRIRERHGLDTKFIDEKSNEYGTCFRVMNNGFRAFIYVPPFLLMSETLDTAVMMIVGEFEHQREDAGPLAKNC